jgi:hypothetical protein
MLQIAIMKMMLVLFIFFLGATYYPSTNVVCIKFVGHNLKDP